MRRVVTLLLAAGLIAGAYVERQALLPYAPQWLAKLVSPDQAEANVRPSGQGKGGGRGAGASRAVAVVTATAEEGSLPIIRRTIGYIRPLASTDLAFETTGLLTEIDQKDGAMVKAGDLIARIDDRAAKANVDKDKAALARDQATLDNAEANLERIEKLVRSGATSTQAGDDALATVKAAQATVGVDQAQLEADQVVLSKTEIRAPFDGRLGAFNLSLGALVQPATTVVSIAQTAPVYAEFALPDTDLATVRKAMEDGTLKVEVRPSLAPENSPAETGPIVFIDNKISETSASITLRARLANADLALWPGQSIDVTVEAGTRKDLVIVPGVAVQPREKGSIAYVVSPGDKIEVRQVEVAMREGGKVGIAEGIKAGDKVVTEGQVDLVDGTPVREVAAPEERADASAAR